MTSADLIGLFTTHITITLMIVCFVSAIISAIVGTIGGLIVVVVGSLFVPFELWLPIQACIQATSNASRFYIGRKFLDKSVCLHFTGGSLFGTLLGTSVVAFAGRSLVLVIANTFILISTWIKMVAFNFKGGIPCLGFLHGFIGGMVGTPGPLGMPTLLHRYKQDAYDKTIVTHAYFAMTSHILRVFAFGLWGYNYLNVWQFIVIFSATTIGGSYLGTHLRDKIANKDRLTFILKIILSALVLSTIIRHAPAVYATIMA